MSKYGIDLRSSRVHCFVLLWSLFYFTWLYSMVFVSIPKICVFFPPLQWHRSLFLIFFVVESYADDCLDERFG